MWCKLNVQYINKVSIQIFLCEMIYKDIKLVQLFNYRMLILDKVLQIYRNFMIQRWNIRQLGLFEMKCIFVLWRVDIKKV